jgi:predicted ATP-grasp superfamily ATP-dependent carboligase
LNVATSPPVAARRVAPQFLQAKPKTLREVAEQVAGSALPPAVVCEVGWVNGLGAVRALGRAGVPAIALDHRPWALGFRSRYALPLLAPDPLPDEDGFVELLLELADVLGRPAPIFPTHDEHLNSLARRADELGDRFLSPFPSWDVLEPLQSKRHQIDTAEKLGLGAPATEHPQSGDEARVAARAIGFPVFVKPSDNIVFKRLHKRQAFVCETQGELDRAYELTAEYEPMVQEFIPGGDEFLWTLGAYVAADGRPLATFSGRKLRQTAENMGSCRVGETVWDDEVVEAGLAMLRELGFHGIAQVEWKRDPRDGALKLIEVNPRLWQWHGLTGECGAGVIEIAYWDLIGAELAPARTDDSRKRWAISLMSDHGTAFQRPPYVDGVFAVDDPKPGLVNAGRFALSLVQRS